MKIVVPGGTGQVGPNLARAFHRDGHEVVVLSRSPKPTPWITLPWDGKTLGPWTEALESADAVINLAGRSVNCRYHARNRREIMDSRIDSTRVLGQAIVNAKKPPRAWLQMSTATIYSHRYDAPNDDVTGIVGGLEANAPSAWKFSIDVATGWEREALAANTPHTRKVLLRTAMVMSPDRGGVFDILLGLTRRGLGGRAGNGRQFMSWIHYEDFIRAVYWLIEHNELSGPVNLAAPNPLPNAEFMRALREAWGIRFGLPAEAWMIEVAVLFMRSESELILKSRRVTPTRLLASGFHFRFPHSPAAARDLVSQWREMRKKLE